MSPEIIEYLKDCTQRNLAPATIDRYRRGLSAADKFCRAIGADLVSMSPQQLDSFVMGKGSSKITISGRKTEIRTFQRFANRKNFKEARREIMDFLAVRMQLRVEKSTIERCRKVLTDAEEYCVANGMNVAAMSASDVDKYLTELAGKGFAPSTISTNKFYLRAFLKSQGVTFPVHRYSVQDSVGFGSLPLDAQGLLIACEQNGLPREQVSRNKNVLLKANAFFRKRNIPFPWVSPDQLKMFEQGLLGMGFKEETVQTYSWRLKRLLNFPEATNKVRIAVEALPTEIEDYLDHLKKNSYHKETISCHERGLREAKHFFDTIGSELVPATGPQTSKLVIHLLRNGFTNNAILVMLNILNRFLLFHGNSRIVKVFHQVKRILGPTPFRSSSPSSGELSLLLKAVDSCQRPTDIAIFYTSFEMGIPASELRGLLIADLELGFGEGFNLVNWDGSISGAMKLRIRGKFLDRTVLVPGRAELAILNYFESRLGKVPASRYLFPNGKGNMLCNSQLYLKLRRPFRNIKIKKGSLAIRHAHIRALFENEPDFQTIWALSGYKTIKSVQRHQNSEVVPVGNSYRAACPRA